MPAKCYRFVTILNFFLNFWLFLPKNLRKTAIHLHCKREKNFPDTKTTKAAPQSGLKLEIRKNLIRRVHFTYSATENIGVADCGVCRPSISNGWPGPHPAIKTTTKAITSTIITVFINSAPKYFSRKSQHFIHNFSSFANYPLRRHSVLYRQARPESILKNP